MTLYFCRTGENEWRDYPSQASVIRDVVTGQFDLSPKGFFQVLELENTPINYWTYGGWSNVTEDVAIAVWKTTKWSDLSPTVMEWLRTLGVVRVDMPDYEETRT